MDDAVDEVELDGPGFDALSPVYLREYVGLLGRKSTCISASPFGFPFSMFLASSAPAWDLKRKTADRNPGSSDFSAANTSASTNSLDHTTINLNVSSVVFAGSLRIKTAEDDPEANAPVVEDCEVVWPFSPENALAVVIDNDWYCCWLPFGRKAWPEEEKLWGLMAFFDVALSGEDLVVSPVEG